MAGEIIAADLESASCEPGTVLHALQKMESSCLPWWLKAEEREEEVRVKKNDPRNPVTGVPRYFKGQVGAKLRLPCTQ